MWTLREEITHEVRHINQMMSGGSFVAVFTLNLLPHSGNSAPLVESSAFDPAALQAFPYIDEGVKSFVAKRVEEGRPVGGFKVTVTHVVPHDDFKGWRFTQATAIALKEIFGKHETKMGGGL